MINKAPESSSINKTTTDQKMTKQEETVLPKGIFSLGSQITGRDPANRYVNENAVRARAGLLLMTAVSVLFILYVHPKPQFITYTIAPVALWDMVAASTFGLYPFSPYGVLATLITSNQTPIWKPAEPKRFAWFLGSIMVSGCIIAGVNQARVVVQIIAGVCILLTWLESVMGFCLGCFIWDEFIAPAFNMKECVECKMDFNTTTLTITDETRVNARKFVSDTIEQNAVVVFSKQVCPHCKRVKARLDQLGAEYKVVEFDTLPNAMVYADALIELTGQKTVPNVFINQKHIGGADATIALDDSGELLPMLKSPKISTTKIEIMK